MTIFVEFHFLFQLKCVICAFLPVVVVMKVVAALESFDLLDSASIEA